MAKFCTQCGTPAKDDAVFCETCGARMTAPAVVPMQRTAQTAPGLGGNSTPYAAPRQTVRTKKDSTALLVINIILGALLVFQIMLALFIRPGWLFADADHRENAPAVYAQATDAKEGIG